MPWIPSHTTLRAHPKLAPLVLRLASTRAQVIGHLHLLWHWAMDYAPNGRLKGCSDQTIAEAAEWKGAPELFVQALKDYRWLDKSGCIHNWDKYGGKHHTQRELNRERKARSRKRTSRGRHADIPRTSHNASPGHPPDVTRPSRARGEERREEKKRKEKTGEGLPQGTVPGQTPGSGPSHPPGDPIDPHLANGSHSEWPSRDEWQKAAAMEGLTPTEIEAEWNNQERKTPEMRWRGIDRSKLRNHAGFVRSKIQERGSRRPAGHAGTTAFAHEIAVPERELKKLN